MFSSELFWVFFWLRLYRWDSNQPWLDHFRLMGLCKLWEICQDRWLCRKSCFHVCTLCAAMSTKNRESTYYSHFREPDTTGVSVKHSRVILRIFPTRSILLYIPRNGPRKIWPLEENKNPSGVLTMCGVCSPAHYCSIRKAILLCVGVHKGSCSLNGWLKDKWSEW